MNDHWIEETVAPAERKWEEFYRNRFQHDKRVRTTHGVNCTGSCSWEVFVKDGIVTWELQATDYPELEEGLPPYEPRGCQRGISYSWYLYSPMRVKYPYARGVLDRHVPVQAKRENTSAISVAAWASHPEQPRSGVKQVPGSTRQGWLPPHQLGRSARDGRCFGDPHGDQQAWARPGRRVLTDPRDVTGQLCGGQPLHVADRRRGDELLRLVLRPTTRIARDLGRADRRARVGGLVQRPVHRRDGREPQHDAHARHTLHLRSATCRRKTRGVQPRLLAGGQVRRLVDPLEPRAGHSVLARRQPRAAERVLCATGQVSTISRSTRRQYTDLPFLIEIDGRQSPASTCEPVWLDALRRCARIGEWKLLDVGRRRGRTEDAERLDRRPLGGGEQKGRWNLELHRQRHRRGHQPPPSRSSTNTTTSRPRSSFEFYGTAKVSVTRSVPDRERCETSGRPGDGHHRLRPPHGPFRRRPRAQVATPLPKLRRRRRSRTRRPGKSSTPASTETPW